MENLLESLIKSYLRTHIVELWSPADLVPALVEGGPVPPRIARRVPPDALVVADDNGVVAVVSRSGRPGDGPVPPVVEGASRRSARSLWWSVWPAR